MSTQTQMTARTFEEMAESLGPCDLIEGKVVKLSPGGYEHNQAVSNAFGLLRDWTRRSKLGRALTNETGLIVARNPDTVRGADVVYYSYERLPQGSAKPGFQSTPPDLVVEVVGKSQGWPEMLLKTSEYLKMGVDRVWVIDPNSRSVHVFRADAEPIVVGRKDTLIDEAILPGFLCRVEEFFAD